VSSGDAPVSEMKVTAELMASFSNKNRLLI